jgi:hypothetical protein
VGEGYEPGGGVPGPLIAKGTIERTRGGAIRRAFRISSIAANRSGYAPPNLADVFICCAIRRTSPASTYDLNAP